MQQRQDAFDAEWLLENGARQHYLGIPPGDGRNRRSSRLRGWPGQGHGAQTGVKHDARHPGIQRVAKDEVEALAGRELLERFMCLGEAHDVVLRLKGLLQRQTDSPSPRL